MSLRQGVPTAGSVAAAGSRTSSREPLTAQSRVATWIERYIHYWLVAPSVLAMCAILVYPLLFSLWVSFFDWRMAAANHAFVGLQNYIEAVTSSFFQFVFIQSIGFTLACLAVNLVIGLALAMLLNRRFHGRGVIRTLFLLP